MSITTTRFSAGFVALALLMATGGGSALARQSRAAQQEPPPGATDGSHEGRDRESAFTRAGGSLARAQSMTQDAPQDSNPFAVKPADPKRIRKHDLVTIIINEQSNSQTKDTTDLKRNADINAVLSQYIKFTGVAQVKGVTPVNPPSLGFTADRNFKGEGTAERSDSMSARVQAEVIDVKPNGNLVLQARKDIKNDDETQHFVLTGYIRAEDVTPDNSVLSNQVADLVLDKKTEGATRDTSKRGWLQRAFDLINPF